MDLTYESLKRISEAVGERRGWDFSRVRDGRDPAPWDYREVVGRFLRLLDIETNEHRELLIVQKVSRRNR